MANVVTNVTKGKKFVFIKVKILGGRKSWKSEMPHPLRMQNFTQRKD